MTHRISKKSIFLIDGSSFLYRAYYGLRPLHTSKGKTVHAVYGFCRMIKKLIDDFNIEHLIIVWDSKGKTERHKIFSGYKATRQAPPSDIFEQKDLIQEFAHLIGIAQLSQVGTEADDLLYSCALKFKKSGYQSIFVTSDKDMRQALFLDILIFDPFKNRVMDVADCEKRYEFPVNKIPFYFAIVGDSSDNIPGVKGIGEKGAKELVQQFHDLDDLYHNLDQIKRERTRELLKVAQDDAYLSYKLFLLHDYAVDVTIHDAEFTKSDWIKALPFFQKLEFKSLIKEVQVQHSIQELPVENISTGCMPLHKKYQFFSITDEKDLKNLCQEIKKAQAFAIDTETDGLDPMQAKLVGVSVAIDEGKAYYIPLEHEEGLQISFDVFVQHFAPILKNSTIKKYMHHAKFDQLVLQQAGLSVCGIEFDTMIAASLLTKEWEKNSLKDLSVQFFDEAMLETIIANTNAYALSKCKRCCVMSDEVIVIFLPKTFCRQVFANCSADKRIS